TKPQPEAGDAASRDGGAAQQRNPCSEWAINAGLAASRGHARGTSREGTSREGTAGGGTARVRSRRRGIGAALRLSGGGEPDSGGGEPGNGRSILRLQHSQVSYSGCVRVAARSAWAACAARAAGP